MASTDTRDIEHMAYRSRWDDGLFDLYLGLSLLWIGSAWLWLDAIAGLAGLLPAILVGPFVAFRTRFIEERSGYVRFSAERRRWERRSLVAFWTIGLGALIVAVALLLAPDGVSGVSDVREWIAPGLIAFILAAMVGVVAAASRMPRLAGYALTLVIGGALAAAYDANPGLPLLVAGAVVTAIATSLVWRFVHAHPRLPHRGGHVAA